MHRLIDWYFSHSDDALVTIILQACGTEIFPDLSKASSQESESYA